MIEIFNKETKKFEEQPKRHSVIFVDKNYIASEEEKDGKTTIVYFDTKLETIVKATVNSDNVKKMEGKEDEEKRETFEMLVRLLQVNADHLFDKELFNEERELGVGLGLIA